MRPVVKHRQPVTLAPIIDPASLTDGDIVLVKVKGRRYMHKISATRAGEVQIANNRGRVNGWTPLDHVYGDRHTHRRHTAAEQPILEGLTSADHGRP